ncbi:unnamed protein product [Linum tenue]|uniref:NmrA-like domain-containing protein n=1 Tax=Linum tenue TaxID=586396 RepID=A0AAV0GWQ6_9ROSI|nr:unnamed protein product [Linum tenue]
MAEKSKNLFIGGTGYIGKYLVEASAQSGDLYDHESLVKAIRQVDVVISTVGYAQLLDQVRIISAIKEAGNIKVDHHYHSSIITLYFSFCFESLTQLGTTAPPRDKVVIFGDGNPKDDPRTLNKILYVRPPGNTISLNDLVSMWEKKIGHTLERVYISEEQLLKNIQESATPMGVVLSIRHSVFVKGDQTNFEIEPSFGVEASELYPEVKYTTVDEYLNKLV